MPASLDKCLLAIANYTQVAWPGSDWAMWAEKDLATLAMYHGDDAAAEAAIGRLTANYADRKDTPAAFDFLGGYCLELKRHEKAEAVYQYLIKNYPNYELAPLAKAELAVVQIRQGNDPNAEAIFQDIMTRYVSHPRLVEAVNLIAEGYYEQASWVGQREQSSTGSLSDATRVCVLKAIEKWNLIVDQLAESPFVTPVACYSLTKAYSRLGEYQIAVQYCARLVDRWPNCEYAWRAHLVALKAYKRQMARGDISKVEGRKAIDRVTTVLLETYPTSPAAIDLREARRQLQELVPEDTSN